MINLILDVNLRPHYRRNKIKEYNKTFKNINEILLYRPKIILLPDDNQKENILLKKKLIEKFNL
jgi:hypothetical protein